MADSQKQLTITVTTKHQDAVKGLVAVGGSLHTLSDQAKQAQSNLKNITAYQDLVNQTKAAGAAWKQQREQVRLLAEEIEKSNDPTAKQVVEFKKAETASAKLKARYEASRTALSGLRGSLEKTGVDTKNLAAEQLRLGTAFQAAKKQAIANTKLNLARGLLDVENPRKVRQEVSRLQAAYKRLEASEKSGVISSRELAQAKRNLKTKIDDLEGSTSRLVKVRKMSLAQLGWMATSFYGAARAVKSLVGAAAEGEKATYLLESAIDAANRQFQVGSMADWGKRIKQLSGELRIYSQTELETATAKTIEMTKRLGLSADQMVNVIKVSADLSAGKTDLAGGIERTTAALRGEAESAEYLGLTLNETYVQGWYETNTAHEKAWKSLTDLEKAQIRYQVLLDQATGTEGRAANSINTLSGAWQYMRAKMDDAIRNNEDLKAAIGEVTQVITENAGSIVNLISTLVSAAGKLAEWILQHKEMAGLMLGTLGTLKLFGGSLDSILSIITNLKAAGIPEILGGSGGAMSATLLARAGLYGALAVAIGLTAKAAWDWWEAEKQAYQAKQNMLTNTQQLTDRLREYRDAIRPEQETIFTASSEQLKTMQQEMGNARGYWSSQITLIHDQLEEAKKSWNSWSGQDQERIAALEAKLDEAKQKWKEYHDSTIEVTAQIGETTVAMGAQGESLDELRARLADAAAQEKEMADGQKALDDAWTTSRDVIAGLRGDVAETAKAYLSARKVLGTMTEGTSEYKDQLAEVARLEKAYVAARGRLTTEIKRQEDEKKQALYQAEVNRLEDEEQALKNSLARRKLDLRRSLQLGVIDRQEYSQQIASLEEDLQSKLLELKEQGVAAAKRILGEESAEYKAQTQERIDAELDLQRQKLRTQEIEDRQSGGGDRGGGSDRYERGGSGGGPESSGFGGSDRVFETDGGKDYLAGVRRKPERQPGETQQDAWDRYEGEIAAAEQQQQRQEQEQQDKKDKAEAANKRGFASGFYGSWDNITNTLNGMTSMAELKKWYQQNRQYLYGRGQLTSSPFARSLNKHATDLYQQRMAELGSVAAKSNQVDNSALQKRNIEQKQITLRFQGQDGKSVSGSFNESEAGKLMDILKKSGMATA